MDTWDMITADRGTFADYLATLTDAQWAAPSLCTEWSVKDVVAHLLVPPTMSKGKVFLAFAGSGFNLDKMSGKLVKRITGQLSNAEVVATVRSTAGVHRAPPGLQPVGMLAELLVHAADISMAIDRPLQLPVAHHVVALDHLKNVQPVLGCKRRIAGLRLRATDTDWSTGDGPLVEGDVQHLIAAMTGRKSALSGLSGEGVATLRGR